MALLFRSLKIRVAKYWKSFIIKRRERKRPLLRVCSRGFLENTGALRVII